MVQLLFWLGLSPRKFQRWKDRYGKANEHNTMIPRDHWIEPAERAAIIRFAHQYRLEGYRRLTFMMLDGDVAAVSPATTYRVLKAAGLIGARFLTPSRKGDGFEQPHQPHEHWHVDFSHVNVGGTFYYLCSVLDGASRHPGLGHPPPDAGSRCRDYHPAGTGSLSPSSPSHYQRQWAAVRGQRL